MNIEPLFLFLILLLGLVLCSFLGVKEGMQTNTPPSSSSATIPPPTVTSSPVYGDYYNHFTGLGSLPQLQNGMVFTDPSGNTITVIVKSDGTNSLRLISAEQPAPMMFTQQSPTTFVSPYGGVTATVVYSSNDLIAIQVSIQGKIIVFTQQSTNDSNTDTNTISSTQYYGSTGTPIQPSPFALSYQGPQGGTAAYMQGPQGGTAAYVQGPQGNSAFYAQGPNGNAVAGYNYADSLPPGIPRSQIPAGQEDLYILKSEIVPPVCPACPTSAACPRQEKCPPCPPCARCPEPSFECKKVPNYNAIDNNYLPTPVLNDFSSFGM